MSESFTDALARRVLLADGAMGTLARASGGRVEGHGAELCVVAPELVTALHERYLAAGADVLQTHTFAASRPRLERHGLARRVREINLAGARLAAAVRDGAGRPAWVAGSVSPVTPPGQAAPADPARAAAAVREQVEALAEGGVDLVVLETFSRADELLAAVEAVREVTDLPVVAQATFVDEDAGHVTTAGESPADVVARLAGAGAVAIGTNCTLGPQGLLDVVRRMGPTDGPVLSAQPNAGLPHVVADRSVRFAGDAEHFARYVLRYVEAGARLVGGCCGTTPEHIAAAARALTTHDAWSPPASPPDPGAPPAPRRRAAPAPVPDETADHTADGAGPGRGAVERWLRPRRSGRDFLVAAEVAGAGGPDEHLARARRAVAGGASVLWVSRPRTRRASTSTAALGVHLHDRVDVDTVLTVTSWQTSMLALQADLLGLHALGLHTLVCETGNPPVHAEQAVRDGVWEVDGLALLRLAAGLNRGVDADGAELGTPTAFRLGARVTPGAEDLAHEAERAVAKVEAGAEFLVTRPVFELERLRAVVETLEAAGRRVPVLASVGALTGYAQAEHLHHEVPDVVVPEAVVEPMRRAGDGPDAADTGLALAADLVAEAADLVEGVVVRWPGPDPATALARLRAAAGGRVRR
ncbi:homocysteine S-methyltransferase family protein [Actinomycetospora straminea]|uniref:Bifunctional homocysteine S-methyltransferase/methylenetetrahydrofolate reductase n=1 Tax=Actinomycetospora straminea TaxID=663607 RepID=A0ABP9E852_9PSEU|nr:homocysteine S-methyltransferase family protein [Actinomycetospora straminea]MDD7936491.1 homocysteine S-methyltransferase family protein [Actinomycetospora straminea]